MAENVLAKMTVEIAAKTAEFQKSLQSTESKLTSFSNGIKGIASTVGVAFGVGAVANFAFEVAKLAGEAEGVRAAFERLPESEALMSRLKDATAGTVSELDLMKRTVQASNFGIGLESLPQLLEFAAIRAQQTGQSVDYLVDSIVTGIGRKSPLILDNLGISAVRLKEQFGGAALEAQSIGDVAKAVGNIATEELQKMGDFSENTSTKIQRLSASWEDVKVALGNAANSSGILAKSLNILTNTLNAFSGDKFTTGFNQLLANMGQGSEILDEFAAAGGKIDLSWQDLLAKGFVRTEEAARKYEKILADIQKRQNDLRLASVEIDPATGLPVSGGKVFSPSLAAQQINTLESLKEKVKELNTQFDSADITDQKRLTNIGQEIIAINEQIKKLEELRKAREGQKALSTNSVESYRDVIKSLNEELEKVNVNDTERIRILSAQIAGYNEAIARVEALKKSFQDVDTTIAIPDLTPLAVNMTAVTERVKGQLAILAGATKTTFEEVQSDVINFGGVIQGALSGIGQALGNAIGGGQSFGKALLGVLGGVLIQLGEMLITAGLGVEAFKASLKSLNGYVAVAAGIALVALGTAVGASMKKLGSSGGGSAPVAATSSSSTNRSISATEAQDVKVTGTVVLRGQDAYIMLKNYNDSNQFLKAGG